ncbi:MAG: DHH family phosphoesterase [Planctomycetes bacterium]|nr:DHH family phosphoesterase [Planctomycetota bacterium]
MGQKPTNMHDYTSTADLAAVAKRLADAKRPLITTHAKPDGDAFGSVIAMARGLRNLGREPHAVFMPPVPANFRQLKGGDAYTLYNQGHDVLPFEPDLVVILDTGAWAQLSPMRAYIEKRLDRTLIIDHHLTGDVPAAMRYIDGKGAACCEVVADVLDKILPPPAPGQSGKIYDTTVAEALFVGLAADTGWFRFSNTRPQTHDLAARLLRLGADHAALYQQLEQTDRPEKLQLMVRALSSLRLIAGGRAAVMVLRGEDFAQTAALVEETERFVDIPQVVGSVQVVVMISEPPKTGEKGGGPIRVSFRSKPGPHAINVTKLAHPFGGGGHARAAGAKIDAPLEQVVERVSAAVEAALTPGA